MRNFVLFAACLMLSSCGSVGKTLDCVDYKRFENCIVFDAFDGSSESYSYKKKGGYSHPKSIAYRSYKPQKIKKPAKVWRNY